MSLAHQQALDRMDPKEREPSENQYNGITDPSVVTFLAEHSYLLPLLHQAWPVISTYFPGAPVYAEILTDPEALDHSKLVLAISPLGDPRDTLDRYDQFNRIWWADTLREAHDRLVIMPEYR